MLRSRKRGAALISAGVLLSACTGPGPCGIQPGAVTSVRDERSASAAFRIADGACVVRELFVTAADSTYGTSEPSRTASTLNVVIVRRDDCSGNLLEQAFGTVDLAEDAFVLGPPSETATLQASLELADPATGRVLPVELELAWTGRGGSLDELPYVVAVEDGPDYASMTCERTLAAEATGEVGWGGARVALDPSDEAELRDLRLQETVPKPVTSAN